MANNIDVNTNRRIRKYKSLQKANIIRNELQQQLSVFRVVIIEFSETFAANFNLNGKFSFVI
jgi:hypothetical protein